MTKVNNLIKENYDLKNELEGMILRLKENEAKMQGFKIVEYALLLSDNLNEISDKSLQYIEEIFDIDKAVLFIKKGIYDVTDLYSKIGGRIILTNDEAFSYTFLEPVVRCGCDKTVIHKDFKLLPNDVDFSYILVPIIEDDNIIGCLGFFSSERSRFSEEHNADFIKDFAFIAGIALKKINSEYRLKKVFALNYPVEFPNKLAMYDRLEHKFEKLKETGQPFSLILFNIKELDKVNDKAGLKAGDKLIDDIGSIIYQNVESRDLMGKFINDKFYVVSSMTSIDDIKSLIVNVEKAVSSLYISCDDYTPAVTSAYIAANKSDGYNDIYDMVKKVYGELLNK